MKSADVKPNIKQQEIKDLAAPSHELLELATFKTSNTIKRVCIFDFGWYSIYLDFVS